ncbi:hypothetical protein [Streptomyces sp. NBC_00073]|uniref:hypothetical protein n=1 Tax=Streptomyces sp. NBC_00073 TaxID=2975640 RepID=UPI0032436C5B
MVMEMTVNASDPSSNLPIVVVDGDTTVDWFMSLPPGHFPKSEERLVVKTSMDWHWGGALLLTSLVKRGCHVGGDAIAEVRGVEPRRRCPTVDEKSVHHSFNLLDLLPLPDPKTGKAKCDRRWRIRQSLGFHPQEKLRDYPGPKISGDELPRMVIINDSDLGFGKVGGIWSRVPGVRCDGDREDIQEDPPWLLLNLRLRGERKQEGDLWDAVYRQLTPSEQGADESITMADRLIVITTVESLRDAGAEVSRGLSWERSAQDILNELQRNERIHGLLKCRRLIVSLGPSGALVIDRSATPPYTLYFDTEQTEGTWEREHSDGKMFGYSQTLTAAIATKLIECDTTPRNFAPTLAAEKFHEVLGKGVELGLSAMHQAYNQGFKKVEGQCAVIEFPFDCMDELHVPPHVGQSRIPEPSAPDGSHKPVSWSILQETLGGQDLYDIASSIVSQGPGVLTNIPLGKIGDLLTVDRRELEALRSIQGLIIDYLEHKEKSKPRSIAIFGSPGDGKSFAVKQIMESLQAKPREPLEFNMSQFQSVAELISALHRVRDRSLEGDVPLVFWDEFDTPFQGQDLGWLRYFLAPMQDGKFQEGQIVHPIGRSIFVFAGGTCSRYSEFSQKASSVSYKNAKGIDFISRLRGYVNVIGPNPEEGSEGDSYRVLRRALLLHTFLERAGIVELEDVVTGEKRKDIDKGVVDAFLKVSRYRSGARSMEAIVDTSTLHKGGRFGRSSLPPQTQLDLHVDAAEFLRIARGQLW